MEPARIVDETVDGLRHEFRIALDTDGIREAVDERLRRSGKKLTVPGFRPGRAPVSVLRNHHGRRVRDGIVDQLAIGATRELIAERGLSPRARPSIHIDPEDPEAFILTLETSPEIALDEMADIALHRLEVADGDAEARALGEEHVRRQLFDALATRYDFAVPREMADSELARILAGYREAVGEEPDPAAAGELAAIAERRIKLALLFAEIVRRHDIRIPRAEIEQMVEEVADREPEHRDEIIDYYLDHPTALAELQSPLLEARVVDFLLERCTVSRETVSAQRLRAVVLGDAADG